MVCHELFTKFLCQLDLFSFQSFSLTVLSVLSPFVLSISSRNGTFTETRNYEVDPLVSGSPSYQVFGEKGRPCTFYYRSSSLISFLREITSINRRGVTGTLLSLFLLFRDSQEFVFGRQCTETRSKV